MDEYVKNIQRMIYDEKEESFKNGIILVLSFVSLSILKIHPLSYLEISGELLSRWTWAFHIKEII